MGPSPLKPWAASQRRTYSLSKLSGSSFFAKRSSYEPANQKRDESGVWISSITTMSPFSSLPISYFVSTRMRPRSLQSLWPFANRAYAISAAAYTPPIMMNTMMMAIFKGMLFMSL